MLLTTFVRNNRIAMTSERVDRNPNMSSDSYMDHWKVTLRHNGHTMTTYFSMGYGHNGKAPQAEDVLDCLASDSAGIDNDFEDWCREYGYDSDSRAAERIYNTCTRQSAKLRKFLGEDPYQQLLY